MQKITPINLIKTCFAFLSIVLLSQIAFGYGESKVSYLDSVSNSILEEQMPATQMLMNAASPDAQPIETSVKLITAIPITRVNAKINLSLRDSDIRQVLRMLADKAKVNIVLDKSVEGRVTLDLNNVTVNDAFLILFKSCQLIYTMDGNTLTVADLKAAKDIAYTRHNMTILSIKYVNAESVADFLNENLFKSNVFGLSTQPVVTANRRTNQLVVFGTNADVLAIKRILPAIDTKPMVNSFSVNHVTPKEMSQLICDSLFYDEESKTGKISVNTDTTKSQGSGVEDLVLGGGVVACRDIPSRSAAAGETGLKAFKTTPLTVTYFTDTGKISVLGGSLEQVEIIKEFIKEHDQKQLMAYIEISVISLNETGTKSFENTWDLWTPFISLGFSKEGGLVTQGPTFIWGDTVVGGGTNGATLTKTNNSALLYQLQYQVTNDNGRILTNPKLMVTSGKKATIDLTSDYVEKVNTQYANTSAISTSTITNKTYDIGHDQGLKIELMAFISPDGYVSMNIVPEFKTFKANIPGDTAGSFAGTLLSKQNLNLKNIRIKDGETLVLAGLIKEQETQNNSKMPILSDLPFIGAFFRASSDKKEREELVIVVTPHIVKDDVGVNTKMNNSVYDL